MTQCPVCKGHYPYNNPRNLALEAIAQKLNFVSQTSSTNVASKYVVSFYKVYSNRKFYSVYCNDHDIVTMLQQNTPDPISEQNHFFPRSLSCHRCNQQISLAWFVSHLDKDHSVPVHNANHRGEVVINLNIAQGRRQQVETDQLILSGFAWFLVSIRSTDVA